MPDHLLAGLDEAVERVRKAPLLDKGAAAEAAFSALRAVLATQQRQLEDLARQLEDHVRRGH